MKSALVQYDFNEIYEYYNNLSSEESHELHSKLRDICKEEKKQKRNVVIVYLYAGHGMMVEG